MMRRWRRVLARFVNTDGEVDFAALAQDRADLDQYLRHVADQPLDSLPDGPVRLAHMINAYNALALFNVLQSGIPASHSGWRKVDFFCCASWPLAARHCRCTPLRTP